MLNFNLKKSSTYSAVKLNKVFQIFKIFEYLFILGFLVSGLMFWINNSSSIGNPWLVFLVLFTVLKVLNWFFETELKKPELRTTIKQALTSPGTSNLADCFSFKSCQAIFQAMKYDKGILDSDTLFYFLLKNNPDFELGFSRALLDFKDILKSLKQEIKKSRDNHLEEIILTSLRIAEKREHNFVEKGDLLIALSKVNSVFRQILVNSNLYSKDIENLVWWMESTKQNQEKSKRFWDYDNLLKKGSIGRGWAAGFTITLDQYSIDWTEIIKKRGFENIIGHTQEINKIERTLAKTDFNNILLIGEPGSGRKSIVHALASKVISGKSLPSLNYLRVVELDLIKLFSDVRSQENANAILEKIFQEVLEARNIILIIDELSNFSGNTQETGMFNISGVLSKYLRLPQFRFIGTSNFAGYHQYLERNIGFSSLVEKIEVKEISDQQAILVLQSLIPFYEKKHNKYITYPAIRDIVNYSIKYLPDSPFPKKAIDLLDETMVHVSRYTKGKLVLPEHVARITSEKVKIPVGELEKQEKDMLLNLESLIHQRIINQNQAVKEVSVAMRRARAEITIRKGPIGAFLFMGPTGVGKTETAKALTQIYFGNENRMIRMDMSEFQTREDIPRLIGGRGENGLLTTQVRKNPFSLILLDEIEKAHPDILNLFLQVIDEGHLTDGFGRKTSFKNSIIIATSNAGYKIILKALEENTEWSLVKQRLLDYLFKSATFRPEFINRFDAVNVFTPLSKQNLLDISHLMLSKLKKNLAQKHIYFEITKELKDRVVELGYNPVFGAREMRRVIQDRIESVLAKSLLSGQIKKGDHIEMNSLFEIIKRG